MSDFDFLEGDFKRTVNEDRTPREAAMHLASQTHAWAFQQLGKLGEGAFYAGADLDRARDLLSRVLLTFLLTDVAFISYIRARVERRGVELSRNEIANEIRSISRFTTRRLRAFLRMKRISPCWVRAISGVRP
jgi:hypothetical protein